MRSVIPYRKSPIENGMSRGEGTRFWTGSNIFPNLLKKRQSAFSPELRSYWACRLHAPEFSSGVSDFEECSRLYPD